MLQCNGFSIKINVIPVNTVRACGLWRCRSVHF